MALTALEQATQRYFATDRNLRMKEATHARYLVPQVDLASWVLHTLDWTDAQTVLDIGAGTGGHYERLMRVMPNLRYYALDLSPQLLRCHPCAAERLAYADALRLPYTDASFDVVMANDMLYLLTDLDSCLREVKRVLKPDGRLLAATESVVNLPELQVLLRRAIVLLSRNGAKVDVPVAPVGAFALENGARILRRHFYAVVRHDLPATLHFPDIEPALDYIDSLRGLREHGLPADVDWDDLMLIMRQQISQLCKVLGKLELTVAYGAMIASDGGDFIKDFVARGGRA
ncbi:MAG: methyltransferase domain-containing protein [Chloroflexi bacterium]|nr:methyltransferase domain-containing protein [Chloroflexota bacterium]MYD39803.1 methyltransferase domain-containing protein [Chloroflexota bacterium]MYI41503.1 methyltransferase domain-containing protein [Chloroflexota bacterium]